MSNGERRIFSWDLMVLDKGEEIPVGVLVGIVDGPCRAFSACSPHVMIPSSHVLLTPHPGRLFRYVDTALQLLERAGDFVSDDIWHRVVQLVTNNESMQQYAARNLVEVLRRGANHEVSGGWNRGTTRSGRRGRGL